MYKAIVILIIHLIKKSEKCKKKNKKNWECSVQEERMRPNEERNRREASKGHLNQVVYKLCPIKLYYDCNIQLISRQIF